MRGRVWRYIRNYKFNSLFVRTYGLILLLAVLPLAGVSFYLARYFQDAAMQQVIAANEFEVAQVRASFDQLMQQTFQLIGDLGTHHKVLRFMTADRGELTPEDRFFLHQEIDLELLHPFRFMPVVHTVGLAALRSDLLISSQRGLLELTDAEERRQFQEVLVSHPNSPGWFALRRVDYPIEEERLALYWRVMPYTAERLGLVYVEFDTQALTRALSLDTGTDFVVLLEDETGTVLLSAEQEWMGGTSSAIVDVGPDAEGAGLESEAAADRPVADESWFATYAGEQALVSRAVSRYGVRITGVQPLSRVQTRFDAGRARVLRIVLVFAAAGILVAFLIAARAVRPVARILDFLEHMDDESDRETTSARRDEVRLITRAIEGVVSSRNSLERELGRRMVALRRAKRTALQSQINPHFLHNTLETIRWKAMAMTSSENEVSDMIARLSRLLRISLDTEDELVTVAAEVEHARLYMEIQEQRYRDAFVIEWDIQAAAERERLVRFTLQPLLENALYHGVKPVQRLCRIVVRAQLESNLLVLTVRDDGAGMPGDAIDRLNADLAGEPEIHGRHIGLRNVNQRIQLMFGGGYGVRVSDSAPGIEVRVTVPATSA